MLNLNFRHFKSLMKAGRIWTQTARLIINWKRRTWIFWFLEVFFQYFRHPPWRQKTSKDSTSFSLFIRETAFPKTWILHFSWKTLRQSRFLGSQSPEPNENLLYSLLIRVVSGGRDQCPASTDNTLVIHSNTDGFT